VLYGLDSHAGAWAVRKNRCRLESNSKFYWADTDFDEDGSRQSKPNSGEYSELQTELKVDFGYTNRLNFLLSFPAKWARYEDDNVDLREEGLEDLRFGAKYVLADDSAAARVTSVSASLKLPAGYDEEDSPPLGDGQIDGEVRLLVGQSFLREFERRDALMAPPGTPGRDAVRDRAFVGWEIGYRWRNEEPADELVYFVQGGLYVAGGISLQGEIDGVDSIGPRGEEEDYHIWRLGVQFRSQGGASPMRLDGELGFGLWYGETFAGENTAEGREVVCKFFCQF